MNFEHKFHLLAIASTVALLTSSGIASAAKPIKLSQVFDPDMIDANLAYFERLVGPARNTYGDTNHYIVGDCLVQAKILGGIVRSLSVFVSPKCTFDLNKFLPNFSSRFPPAHNLTFGKVDSITGGKNRFYADCLGICGNSATDYVYQHWAGSKFHGYYQVIFAESNDVGPTQIARDKWQDAMEKAEGYEWIAKTKFNCTDKYDSIAHRVYQDIRVSSITIGKVLEVGSCSN